MGVCPVCNAEVADDQMEEHAKMHGNNEEAAAPAEAPEAPAEEASTEEAAAPAEAPAEEAPAEEEPKETPEAPAAE